MTAEALALGTSGARVDQAEGTASAKTPRQEQLDVFMDRGGGRTGERQRGGRTPWSEQGQRQRTGAHLMGRTVSTQRWILLCCGKELRVLSRKVT